jgi:hypothetical protein
MIKYRLRDVRGVSCVPTTGPFQQRHAPTATGCGGALEVDLNRSFRVHGSRGADPERLSCRPLEAGARREPMNAMSLWVALLREQRAVVPSRGDLFGPMLASSLQ